MLLHLLFCVDFSIKIKFQNVNVFFYHIFVSIRFISPVLLLFFMLSGASLNLAGMRQIRPSGVRCYSGKEKSPPRRTASRHLGLKNGGTIFRKGLFPRDGLAVQYGTETILLPGRYRF